MKIRGLQYVMLLVIVSNMAIAAECRISSNGIVFGARPATLTHAWDTLGEIMVTCAGTVGAQMRYRIDLQQSELAVTSGDNAFPYSFYLDVNRLQRWGDGSRGTQPLRDGFVLTAPIATRSYPIYARAFPARLSSVGHYRHAPIALLVEE
jgi:spore coat protein U-like protein